MLFRSPRAIEDAAKILADVRKALGGEQKLTGVKTIVATGRTRRVSGENLVPVEFEIDMELPDKYVRKDEIPAQESEPSSSGFNADALIQIPPPPQQMAENQRRQRVTTLKQDFARLTLGMFAASFPTYPLAFAFVAQAEAPQGKARRRPIGPGLPQR